MMTTPGTGSLGLIFVAPRDHAARTWCESDTTPGRLFVKDFIRAAGLVEDPQVPRKIGKAAMGGGVSMSPASRLQH